MQKFAIIGFPLEHSMSPKIHNLAFQFLDLPATYEKLEIEASRFTSVIPELKKQNEYKGFSVTIPYKQQIIGFLDKVDEGARQIGAVNTIVVKNGHWFGLNTDLDGFIEPLTKMEIKPEKCLILGNGGAARAVLYALSRRIMVRDITVAGRHLQKVKDLVDEFTSPDTKSVIRAKTIEEACQNLSDRDLIVNATPVGTFPDIDRSPLPLKANNPLKKNVIVYDLVYNPQRTKLLKETQNSVPNGTFINGWQMLLGQAAKAFYLWTGLAMPLEQVKRELIS